MSELLIEIESVYKEVCPNIQLGVFYAEVEVAPSNDQLKEHIAAISHHVQSRMSIEQVSERQNIASTRDVYRSFGKKPGRYRPSAEALNRRILNGKGWYEINNVVDLLNAVSLESGWSIGGYDFSKIQGKIQLGIGQENEPYQAVGRGKLNIAKLPLLRDEIGAFGSPTSDSERTKIVANSKVFLMIIFDFAGTSDLDTQLEKISKQYATFCSAQNRSTSIIRL